MPSSLIIVALVVAWLLVLVPIVARRRQEVARTADSMLAARVVRSGGVRSTAEEEFTMADAGEADTKHEVDDYDEFDSELDGDQFEDHFDDPSNPADEPYDPEYDYDDYAESGARPYRPGRGGFDPEAAAMTARARYGFRQRVVVLMLMAALISGLVAGLLSPLVWWIHAAVDVGLVGYLGYLRRQVRIEEEIRERRTARLGAQRRVHTPHPTHDAAPVEDEVVVEDLAPPEPQPPTRRPLTWHVHPGAVVVDTDDEDPMFTDLEEPGAMPYRRAAGE
ncbi:MAG TPA: gephyrin-like molybdotransferase receptor GlpR [Pseudonocardiaceae bacterium]|jgi:hypothetical protein|nr:gephyrin-like molybdotransferase receptor GlpR [Pseudonocardiaceae bacterium]